MTKHIGFVQEEQYVPFGRICHQSETVTSPSGEETIKVPGMTFDFGLFGFSKVIAGIILGDKIRHGLLNSKGVKVCRSENGQYPVDEDTSKDGPCRDEEGNPVCPYLIPQGDEAPECRESRLLALVRFRELERMIEEGNPPVSDEDWQRALSDPFPCIFHLSRSSLWAYRELKAAMRFNGRDLGREVVMMTIDPREYAGNPYGVVVFDWLSRKTHELVAPDTKALLADNPTYEQKFAEAPYRAEYDLVPGEAEAVEEGTGVPA
jgi:hypothetical protein